MITLRSTDLMIGDWVKFPIGYEKIQEISYQQEFGGYCVWFAASATLFPCKVEDIEPIPLIPEILEKNGFEDIGDDTWQLTDRPYWFWIDFFNHRYGCEFDTSSYENESSESRLYLYGIPDVHELQHAMKLCGIEKTIEL